MKRKEIIEQNKIAKMYLAKHVLTETVNNVWETIEVQKQVENYCVKFKNFAEELIKHAPEELQANGRCFLECKAVFDEFNEDAFMVFECNVHAAKKAYEIFGKEFSEVEMLTDFNQTIQETVEMLLNELMEEIYKIPENTTKKISDFIVNHLI